MPAKDGAAYVEAEGEFYRMYDFVHDSICLDAPETDEDFYQSAVAFGSFQRQLADFPANELSETIPRFHDTPNRYRALRAAIEKDALGRAASCREEIEFALAREADAAVMINLLAAGELPLRVTHNDTKLNNVMLDAKTRRPLCVIDLDTVMPGLAANDFGDSIRFGANTRRGGRKGSDEDQPLAGALRGVRARFSRGVRQGAYAEGNRNPALGREADDARMRRALFDGLSGGGYAFRIHRPEHNLDRTRTQFALVADMEKKWTQICDIVKEF